MKIYYNSSMSIIPLLEKGESYYVMMRGGDLTQLEGWYLHISTKRFIDKLMNDTTINSASLSNWEGHHRSIMRALFGEER